MLSRQVLLSMIQDINDITGAACSIWSAESECLATVETETVQAKKWVEQFIRSHAEQDVCIKGTYALFCVRDGEAIEYVLLFESLQSDRQMVETQGKLCVSQLRHLLLVDQKKPDRNRFIQELLLDRIPEMDLFNQAKRLRISHEQRRVVFVVEPKGNEETIVIETVKGLYATGTGDFVTAVAEGHIILVKSLEITDGYDGLAGIAESLVDTLGGEAMVSVRIAYGTIVDELKDISRSFKEARMALDVGRVFYAERSVLAYRELGIGRLIHQLPFSLCQMFLEEVFSGQAEEGLDEEALAAVNKFFEYDLNISETARQLYLHRNTLMYRLEKIQKQTGLDVRRFDDAVTFKIAMMVSKHIKYQASRKEEMND